MTIPKIIHQIWSETNEPLPVFFKTLGETWREHHKEWEYEFWNNNRMNTFIQEFYPQYWTVYNSFTYDIQRWDVIRYLILDKMGGVYVDFDTECLKPFETLLAGHSCCFSMEYGKYYNRDFYFNNALIASVPNHPFMKLIIDKVFQYDKCNYSLMNKGQEVIESTGPLALVKLYEGFEAKDQIYLIPPEYVSPFLKEEVIICYEGNATKELKDSLEKKIQKAYSVHYFFNTWLHGVSPKTLNELPEKCK